ncbi:MAG TPA: DUF4265 domain-containing protein, partial [Fimbriimonas sp.]|nr:DUF4265 domain-containing protein [Fimbriimonas sp.]
MSEVRMPDAKVRISTTRDRETEHETLWATSLGNDLYKLDNSPFYAYDVSWEDVVRAVKIEGSGVVQFQEVVKRSGNKTIRIIFDEPLVPGNASQRVADALVKMGCSYEGVSPTYQSV